MTDVLDPVQFLAYTVYEARIVLPVHTDSPVSDSEARVVAKLMDALYPHVYAVLAGQPFDCAKALEAIAEVDEKLWKRFTEHFSAISRRAAEDAQRMP